VNATEPGYQVSTRFLWLAVAICLAVILVACGGGGGGGFAATAGVGSGGTGAAFSGPISGFGSIIVNGVRIDDSDASITLDDDAGARTSDLKLGMMVDVEGERDAGGMTGKANRIAAHSFARGPVSGIDNGRLTVLGVTVTVTSRTVFDGAGVTDLASLRMNDAVEVHGIRNASGGVNATRIERKAGGSSTVVVTGVVQDAAGSRFTVNGATVHYQPGSLVDMPDGIAAGILVQVKGTMSGADTLTASSVRQLRPAPAAKDHQHVELDGVVTAFTSAAAFDVNGMPVTIANGAKVEGVPALGAQVQVGGSMAGGALVADKVEVEDDSREKEDPNELHGQIANLDRTANTFTMRNGSVTVKWDGNTKFDKTLGKGEASLAEGVKLEVKGKVKGNVVLASKVKAED
jgi:hypothetical protein